MIIINITIINNLEFTYVNSSIYVKHFYLTIVFTVKRAKYSTKKPQKAKTYLRHFMRHIILKLKQILTAIVLTNLTSIKHTTLLGKLNWVSEFELTK